ncbi:HAD-IIB family hydrolase [Gallibacterium anatis]|uniref:HAD-IIB family hydrolase n=1 Tax=Gallibacterium anatis TaxID=750 RepID=UPI0039FB9E6E
MNYQAVAFDLDGTLLNSQGQILAENKQAIAKLQQQGVKVLLVTGRHHTAVIPYYVELGLTTPIICCNGAYVYDVQNDKVLAANPLALDFIRRLIKKHGKNGVYLWDPYLSSKDLLETVFFSPYANTPIKALTGLKSPDGHSDKTKEYKEELEDSIIENGWLNLIFLNADKSKIGDFHDRFIIFPKNQDNPARVWSLGTSVNSLGKSHHIIQKVEDGQIIEDVFEEMWEQSVTNTENIIWKSKSN